MISYQLLISLSILYLLSFMIYYLMIHYLVISFEFYTKNKIFAKGNKHGIDTQEYSNIQLLLKEISNKSLVCFLRLNMNKQSSDKKGNES